MLLCDPDPFFIRVGTQIKYFLWKSRITKGLLVQGCGSGCSGRIRIQFLKYVFCFTSLDPDPYVLLTFMSKEKNINWILLGQKFGWSECGCLSRVGHGSIFFWVSDPDPGSYLKGRVFLEVRFLILFFRWTDLVFVLRVGSGFFSKVGSGAKSGFLQIIRSETLMSTVHADFRSNKYKSLSFSLYFNINLYLTYFNRYELYD